MSTFQLKLLIVALFILMFISLFDGILVLFKDNGAPESRRTFHRLVIRVTLAACLLGAMGYGFYTGKLQSSAPWTKPGVEHTPR